MKKIMYITCMMLLFLVGCNDDTQQKSNNENNMNNVGQNEMHNENNDEQLGSENNGADNEMENNEVNDENEMDEEMVVEDVEPLYEISSVSSIKPLEDADAPENVVLITIDDVFLSQNVYALEMAEILHELDAKAIFFVNGLYIDLQENQEILKKIHELGFEIGNHSMTHPLFSQIPEEQQRSEIIELNDKIEQIVGERPRFFRAPHGVNTDITKQVVEEEGMQWMNWSYGFDFMAPYMEKDALVEIMLDPGKDGENIALMNGSNLLFHDRSFTRDALKEIVEGLREKGFEILDPALIK